MLSLLRSVMNSDHRSPVFKLGPKSKWIFPAGGVGGLLLRLDLSAAYQSRISVCNDTLIISSWTLWLKGVGGQGPCDTEII